MFLTNALMGLARGPLRLWKRRRVFRMTAHLYGRSRNCYSNAVRQLHRALRATSGSNRLKDEDRQELWVARIDAGCDHLGFTQKIMRDSLDGARIFLAKRMLADLAIWEPRSFKAIASLGWKLAHETPEEHKYYSNTKLSITPPPKGIITRGMLKRTITRS